eukprot:jgi/Ulvmu1/5571/UM023_0108.1
MQLHKSLPFRPSLAQAPHSNSSAISFPKIMFSRKRYVRLSLAEVGRVHTAEQCVQCMQSGSSVLQGLTVILANHEEIADEQCDLSHYTSAILASRAISASVAYEVEERLMHRTPPLPMQVMVVHADQPTASGLNGAASKDQASLHLKAVTAALGHEDFPVITVAAKATDVGAKTITIDLDQQLVHPNSCTEQSSSPCAAQLHNSGSVPNASPNVLEIGIDKIGFEEQIEEACREADGGCMACTEPVHVAMIPLDRSAFIHRNKIVMEKLVLVSETAFHPCGTVLMGHFGISSASAQNRGWTLHGTATYCTMQMESQGLFVAERAMSVDLIFSSTAATVFWDQPKLDELPNLHGNASQAAIMAMVSPAYRMSLPHGWTEAKCWSLYHTCPVAVADWVHACRLMSYCTTSLIASHIAQL